MEQFTYPSSNKRETIAYYHFKPEGKVKGVVQIIHGMCEHILRYEEFATFLNTHGIAVMGHDHMAHGNSVYYNDGEFLDANQWSYMIEDAHILNQIIRSIYPNIPITIFCHSMGSFVGRLLASTYPTDVDKLVICGTAGKNSLAFVGKNISLILAKLKGGDHKSILIDQLSFGAFNKQFKPAKTKYDWLSTDEKEVAKYINDPKCGYLFSVNGSATLTDLVMNANSPTTFENTHNHLPIFIISGQKDPVSNSGKGAYEVQNNYLKRGCTSVTLKLYKDMRHEILLDVCKTEVMNDVLKFIMQA